MANIVEFTIKTLDLRIKKATFALNSNKTGLKFAKEDGRQDEIKKYTDNIKRLESNLTGYSTARDKLQSNGVLTPTDAEYIIKGLNIRKKRLNENVAMLKNSTRQHEQALKTKENAVVGVGGSFTATIQHYDDVSIKIIKENRERIDNINGKLDTCEVALEFFQNYL